MKKYTCICCVLLLLCQSGYGQKSYPSVFNRKWKLDFVLADFPHQIDVTRTYGGNIAQSYATMSFAQSAAMSANFSRLLWGTYWEIVVPKSAEFLYRSFRVPGWVTYTVYGALPTYFFVYIYGLPGSYFWQIAERIKAIGAVHGLPMDNAINRFNSRQLVFNIQDEGLARMKSTYPLDFIRLYSISSETSAEASRRADQALFFGKERSWLDIFAEQLGQIVTNILYITYNNSVSFARRVVSPAMSATPRQKQGLYGDLNGLSNITSSVSWVYELFHQNDPYSARGTDENGYIYRYVGYDKLSPDARQYLEKVLSRSWLNVVSPLALGIQSIPLGGGVRGNFSLNYVFAPFGTDTWVNILIKRKRRYGMVFTYHHYQNYHQAFPGFELQWKRQVVYASEGKFVYVSPHVLCGWQPVDFGLTKPSPSRFVMDVGGRVHVDWTKTKHVLPFVELGYKTAGWTIGTPYTRATPYGHIGMVVGW